MPQYDRVRPSLPSRDKEPSRQIASQCFAGRSMVFEAHENAFAFSSPPFCGRKLLNIAGSVRHRSEDMDAKTTVDKFLVLRARDYNSEHPARRYPGVSLSIAPGAMAPQ